MRIALIVSVCGFGLIELGFRSLTWVDPVIGEQYRQVADHKLHDG